MESSQERDHVGYSCMVLCLLKKVIGPIKVHVNNKGIIDGFWRGERKCIDPKAGRADFWIKYGKSTF